MGVVLGVNQVHPFLFVLALKLGTLFVITDRRSAFLLDPDAVIFLHLVAHVFGQGRQNHRWIQDLPQAIHFIIVVSHHSVFIPENARSRTMWSKITMYVGLWKSMMQNKKSNIRNKERKKAARPITAKGTITHNTVNAHSSLPPTPKNLCDGVALQM